MTRALLLLAVAAAAASSVDAQKLVPHAPEGVQSEVPLWKGEAGDLHATRVTVKFDGHAVATPRGVEVTSTQAIRTPYSRVASALRTLRQRYGPFQMVKRVPSAVWGDSLRTNLRTGRLVRTPDLSQLFALDFEKPVPTDEVVRFLEEVPGVAYAEGPFSAQVVDEPGDTAYSNQWELPIVDAPKAWGLVKGYQGDRPAGIAISDTSPHCAVAQDLPLDLQTPVKHIEVCGAPNGDNDPFHVIHVSSVAGAQTDNGNAGPGQAFRWRA